MKAGHTHTVNASKRRTVAAIAAAAVICGSAHAAGPVLFPKKATLAQGQGSATATGGVVISGDVPSIDAALFFQQLVQRYRTLRQYKDEARLVEVTQREGQQPQRRESHLSCEITDAGELKIRTPGRSVLSDLGLDIPFRTSEPMREVKRGFELWLAPHLGLHFWDDPLHDMNTDARNTDALQPRRARPVKVGDRAVVQLELSSDDDTDADGQGDTSYDLYVDAESMLVERVEGRERLPDGASYETTLEITSASARAQDGERIELPSREDEPRPGNPERPPLGTDTPQTWDEPAEDDEPSPAPPGPSPREPESGGHEREPESSPPNEPPPASPPTMHAPH